ncbi:MAG: hypothetical protein Q4F69_07580, partial [Bacteroidia bacterium]|nr:hypothetical protein [Bacteroidia bacterium]
MKRFGLIISALALVLGLAQCAKKPNMPTFGGVEPSTKTITFTTNGGGDKGDFTQVSDVLNYKWNKYNDVIHVYLENTEGENFTGGDYLGEMHIVSMADDYSATFEATFTADFPNRGIIRFVHCGADVNVEKGNSADVDFSTQDGSIETISDKVIAVCDQKITEDCTYKFDDCNLTVQFGVV